MEMNNKEVIIAHYIDKADHNPIDVPFPNIYLSLYLPE